MKHVIVGVACTLALSAAPALAQGGNGAPSGGHYNLNILGKTTCAGSPLTGSNRHTIQVLLNFSDGDGGIQLADLDRRNKIFLKEGEFQVLDGNACDRDGATFQLPANPFNCPVDDPECIGSDPDFQNYTVWARALGKPGGSADIKTCGVNSDDEVVCSTESVILVRNTGRSKFTNYTKELTTVVTDLDGDGRLERVGLFEDEFEQYLWDYDNFGLRLAQLRFYPVGQ